MPINDLSDLVNKLTGGNNGNPQSVMCFINSRVAGANATAPVVGKLVDLWQYESTCGGAGAVPTSSVVPTNTTNGAFSISNASGSRQNTLTGMSVQSNGTGSVILYDRLVHQGGLSGTSITTQTTNLPTTDLTRYTNGLGNMIMITVYTLIGATARNITVSYQNENNSTSTSKSVAIGGTGDREAQRCIFVPLADGDRGVIKINSVILDASTGTVGNFGVSIIHPIVCVPLQTTNMTSVWDFITMNPVLPVIHQNACLRLVYQASTTTLPNFFVGLNLIEV